MRIPDILTPEEAQHLFMATNKLSYRVFFFTLYSMGLRLSEGLALEVGDIDASHMRVHIRDSKGNKDRLVPLPVSTLHILRQFWSVHKHPRFLFPNRKRGLKNAHLATTPMDRGGVQVAMAAVDIIELQKILRHVSILTTAKYTHLTSATHQSAVTQINQLMSDFLIHWGTVK